MTGIEAELYHAAQPAATIIGLEFVRLWPWISAAAQANFRTWERGAPGTRGNREAALRVAVKRALRKHGASLDLLAAITGDKAERGRP